MGTTPSGIGVGGGEYVYTVLEIKFWAPHMQGSFDKNFLMQNPCSPGSYLYLMLRRSFSHKTSRKHALLCPSSTIPVQTILLLPHLPPFCSWLIFLASQGLLFSQRVSIPFFFYFALRSALLMKYFEQVSILSSKKLEIINPSILVTMNKTNKNIKMAI